MAQTTELRESVLLELDKLLNHKGFRRKKGTYSWKRKITDEQTFIIHLNFGLNVDLETLTIVPSVFLRSEWFAIQQIESEMLDAEFGRESAHFGKRLTTFRGIPFYSFTINDKPHEIAKIIFKDIEEFGLPFLDKICDYNLVYKLLSSDNTNDWVVEIKSQRARYLPLLLILLNRKLEAFETLELMSKEIEGKDIIIPNFSHFKDWFTRKFRKS